MAGQVSGVPGQNYSNRSDLALGGRVPAQTAPSQQYGQRKAQEEAQRQVPMGTPSLPFNRPSERPNEPITAGMDIGDGPGSEALTAVSRTNEVLPLLLALYRLAPYDDLRRLIERVQRSGQ